MKVTPLGTGSVGRIRDTLLSHGWDTAAASAAADGIRSGAVHATGLDAETVERIMVYAGGTLGLDVMTGEDWVVIGGSHARLSTLARPWGGPPELSDIAHAVGMALPAVTPASWTTRLGPMTLERPRLVGILNVTPDSFSDGGDHFDPDAAVRHAVGLIANGADMVDVGGESTRPGRPAPVTAVEEMARVLPVIEQLHQAHPGVPLSVDTVKAEVARPCLERGAAAINDVSGGRLDPELAAVVAEFGAGLVLMHSRGTVSDMATYDHAEYGDLVNEVVAELAQAIERAVGAGVSEDRIAVDPGLGFAKRASDNWLLMNQLEALATLGRPIMIGPSRKRFLGTATGRDVRHRDVATAAVCAIALQRGATLFRVHDVEAVGDALAVALATKEPGTVEDDVGHG